jgi:chromosome segregation ATPase
MTDTNQAVTLASIESLIKNSRSRLVQLEEENRQLKDMFNSILENDPEYVEADKQAKKLSKEKTAVKSRLKKQENAKDTVQKIEDNQFQIRELKTALSDYLAQFVSLSGLRQIETEDGKLMDIVYTAKLVAQKA